MEFVLRLKQEYSFLNDLHQNTADKSRNFCYLWKIVKTTSSLCFASKLHKKIGSHGISVSISRFFLIDCVLRILINCYVQFFCSSKHNIDIQITPIFFLNEMNNSLFDFFKPLYKRIGIQIWQILKPLVSPIFPFSE